MSDDQRSGSDATPTLRGIVYQFYVVLKCLQKLKAGEKVLIERHGDVSVLRDLSTGDGLHLKQIEVKHYDDLLTDQHLNFWNTLKNWVRDDSISSKYAALILHTTQAVSPSSKFLQWNSADVDQRVTTLKEIKATADARFAKHLADHPSAKKSEACACIDEVLSDDTRLRRIIERVWICGDQPNSEEMLNEIVNDLAYNIPEERRKAYVAALLGFILEPPQSNDMAWEIAEADFKDYATLVAGRFCRGPAGFPQLLRQEVLPLGKDRDSYLFIEKILAIDYGRSDVLAEAVEDYRLTFSTIVRYFRGRPIDEARVERYQDDLLAVYHPRKRSAQGASTAGEWIRSSQRFYDDIMALAPRSFPDTVACDQRFQNGMFQFMADDRDAVTQRDIKWDLREGDK